MFRQNSTWRLYANIELMYQVAQRRSYIFISRKTCERPAAHGLLLDLEHFLEKKYITPMRLGGLQYEKSEDKNPRLYFIYLI